MAPPLRELAAGVLRGSWLTEGADELENPQKLMESAPHISDGKEDNRAHDPHTFRCVARCCCGNRCVDGYRSSVRPVEMQGFKKSRLRRRSRSVYAETPTQLSMVRTDGVERQVMNALMFGEVSQRDISVRPS
jgi:hypothetical protein